MNSRFNLTVNSLLMLNLTISLTVITNAYDKKNYYFNFPSYERHIRYCNRIRPRWI